jgi:hypothetical protein
MAVWYLGSTKHTAVAQWAANTVYGAGSIVRQLAAPSVGNERCFQTALGGTSHATTEPIWVLTKGAAQPADGTVADWLEVTGNTTYGWTAAHARLATAFSWAAAGDVIYVSNNHAETQAANITVTTPGTAAAPCNILCVTDTATPPTTLNTTATITANGNYNLTINGGYSYFYGITFICGVGASSSYNMTLLNNAVSAALIFDNCVLNNACVAGGSTPELTIGINTSDDLLVRLINSNIKFNQINTRITHHHGNFQWRGGAYDASVAVPTNLFIEPANGDTLNEISGVDLSGIGASKYLVQGISGGTSSKYYFKNCKLNASVTVLGTQAIVGHGGLEIFVDNCDSGDTNYRMGHYKYQGSIVTETTIKRTAGANDGTTGFCWKMVSLATGPLFPFPLGSPPMIIWNDTTGSEITATIEIVHDSLTNLEDDEIWVEVEYLGTSGFPLSLFANDKTATPLTSLVSGTGNGSAQADSSESWTTTGLTNPNTQKLNVAFTPQEKGPIIAKVMLAKSNYTVYVCPKVEIT